MANGITNYQNWLNQNPDAVDGMVGGFVQPQQPPAQMAAANTSQYSALEEMLNAQQPTPTNTAPAPQQPVAAPVAAPVIAPMAPVVSPATKNLKKALEQLSVQDLAGQNESTESIRREGESKIDAAKGRANVMTVANAKARRYMDSAEKEVTGNKEEKDQAESWEAEDMRKLREPPIEKTGWQKAVSALTGILGGVLQGYLGPVGGGLAFGLQAIDDHVSENVRKQLEEQAIAEANLKHSGTYIDRLDKDSANELDLGSKLVANHYLATSHELDKMAEESKVPELKEGYTRFAIESSNKARNILRGNYLQQQADARAAAAAKIAASNKAVESERQRVKDAIDADKSMAEADKLRAEADKARNEGGARVDAEGSAVVSTGKRTDQQQTEFDKRASAYDGLRPHLMNLSSMAGKSGKEAKAIFGASADAAGALLSVARGQGQQSESEKKASWTGLIPPSTWDSWDTYSDEERQRIANEAIRMVEEEVSGSLATYRGTIPEDRRLSKPEGWKPRAVDPSGTSTPAAPAQPSPAVPEKIRMVREVDGKVVDVPSDRIQAARNAGFKVPGEMTQKDANAPLAADAEEDERIKQSLASIGG